jgi:hypothetical protein
MLRDIHSQCEMAAMGLAETGHEEEANLCLQQGKLIENLAGLVKRHCR